MRPPSSWPPWDLLTARLVGVCALGALAQAIVDMPGGYFGPADHITAAGTWYAWGLGLAGATTIVGIFLRQSWAPSIAVPLVLSLNVGAFIPALASDPLIAGVVVLWNLTLLAAHFVPTLITPIAARRVTLREPGSEPPPGGRAIRHLGAASLILSLAVAGYRLSTNRMGWIICLALGCATLLAALPLLRQIHRRGSRAPLLVLLPVAGSLVSAAFSTSVMLALLAVAEIIVLLLLAAQLETTREALRDFYDHPSWLVVGSFALLVLVGTVLLSLPAATPHGERIDVIDALFTATSAVCVTGLIVLDTPHDFSTLGQIIILGLIQIGGLGIMVLSAFAAILLGGGLGLRGEQALTELLELPSVSGAYRLARFIVLSTLAVEAIGALTLAPFFAAAGNSTGQAIWNGVFHSVSAFCNAGFALQSDSLILFQERPLAVIVVATLVILGGLGFMVLATTWRRFFERSSTPVNIQVRIVLAASAVLLLVGATIYALLEWNRSLGGLSLTGKFVGAFFQSVTLRTAGFSTVDLSTVAPATILLMLLFMFIGASPGSTGGGIKTTTVMVLLAAIRAIVRPRGQATLFDREVPQGIVYRALAITVISAAIVVIGLFLLLSLESQPFLELTFETMSAFGTVGLSLGATSKLGPLGRLVIVALMFIGRVGPLTLAIFLGTTRSTAPFFRFPQARIMVG